MQYARCANRAGTTTCTERNETHHEETQTNPSEQNSNGKQHTVPFLTQGKVKVLSNTTRRSPSVADMPLTENVSGLTANKRSMANSSGA